MAPSHATRRGRRGSAAVAAGALALLGGAATAAAAPADGQRAAARPPIGYAELDRADRQLVQRIANIRRAFAARAGQIWSPAFRPDRMPFAYVRVQGGRGRWAYVLNNPGAARLAGARRVALPARFGLGRLYRVAGGAFVRRVGANSPFDTGWRVAGRRSMMIAYAPGSRDANPARRDFELFVVHEAFHRFQDVQQRWMPAPGAALLPIASYPSNKPAAALAQLEDRILFQGTGAVAPARALELLRQFLAAREARRAVSAVVGTHDENQEKFEGTARYVEGTYGRSAAEPRLNRFDLSDPWRFAGRDPGFVRQHLSFRRFYAVGAVVANLLDRATGGSAWRAQMAGTPLTPAQLAAQVAGPFDRATALAAAKQQHDFAAIEAQIAGLRY